MGENNLNYNITQPLSKEYANAKELYLQNGKAYQIAENIKKMPSHQIRKVFDVVKSASNMVRINNKRFEEARITLYSIVPLVAYNYSRSFSKGRPKPGFSDFYNFIVGHINDKALQSYEDIYKLDELFTSIVAYQKLLEEDKKYV